MKRLIYFSMALSMLWITSCKQEEKPQADKRIQFTFANPPQGGKIGGRASATIDPQSLMVTIQDDAGNTVADRKELALYKFGGNFLSLPLTLKASSTTNYRLSEFFVIDTDNKVVYVTPKEGSTLAHLVADPLDIAFAVDIDKITTVAPEVIAVDDNASADDYGYGQFGFKVMETFSVVFSSFVKGVSNFELTTAHLKVEGLSDNTDNATVLWAYETELEDKANILTLKEAAFFRIKAIKQGYETWNRTITLKKDSKLEILFEKRNIIVDVYVAGYDGGNATYWKNGIPITLNKGWSSSATSIHVFNNDVYVTVSADENPQYWKNGEKKFLPIPSGAVRCATSDIIVREDEVHVCGDYVIQNNSKAAYWKNGERTELQIPAPFTNAKADKMTIDGADVYIAGYVLTWNTSLLTAALWKNGRFIPLPVPTNYAVSRAIGVKVSSGHTYVSG